MKKPKVDPGPRPKRAEAPRHRPAVGWHHWHPHPGAHRIRLAESAPPPAAPGVGELVGVLGVWLLACLGHVYWWSQNLQPPGWDSSTHLLLSLDYLRVLQDPAAWGDLLTVSIYYPPLFHLSQALYFWLAAPGLPYAAGVNLFWLWLLLLAVGRLGRHLGGPGAGLLAAALVACCPFLAGLVRESLLETCLAALVAWTVWLLVQSRGLGQRRPLIWLGLLGGLGLLAKWTYPLWVAAPFLWALAKGIKARSLDWRGLLAGLVICLLLALPWYLHTPYTLAKMLWANGLTPAPGGPDPASPAGIAFYLLRLGDDQLLLGLGLMTLVALAWALARKPGALLPLWLWLLGGLACLSLLPGKDSRFAAPGLPAAGLLLAAWVRSFSRPLARGGLAALALGLALAGLLGTGFGLAPLAAERGLRLGGLDLRLTAAATEYANPPRREAWAVPEILEAVVTDWGGRPGKPRLGVPPALPHFHRGGFAAWAGLGRYPVNPVSSLAPEALRIGRWPGSADPGLASALAKVDYLALKTGEVTTLPNQHTVPPHGAAPDERKTVLAGLPSYLAWVADFALPDGSRAYLLAVRP